MYMAKLSLSLNSHGFGFSYTVHYHKPPLQHIDDFSWFLLLTDIDNNSLTCNHVIVGDFNLPGIDLKTMFPKNRAQKVLHTFFLEFLHGSDLKQPITSPTHVGWNNFNLVLSNINDSFPTLEPSYSSHFIISYKWT